MYTPVLPPTLPSFVIPSVLIIVPYVAVLLLSAYAVTSFHRRRLLEVRLDVSQAHSVQALVDRDRQILLLRTENGELRTRILKLQLRLDKTAEGSVLGDADELLQLERRWAREKNEVCKSYELTTSQLKREIVELKEKARTSVDAVGELTRLYSMLQRQEALCKAKEKELRRCERDKQALSGALGEKDDQIAGLRERLSECYHRLQSCGAVGNGETMRGQVLFESGPSSFEEADPEARRSLPTLLNI